MSGKQNWAILASELTDLLGLSVPPVAITFRDEEVSPAHRYVSEMPPPVEDGRTGAVPAGCVFWMKATEATFSTEEQDHGNCSVGSFTHGFKSLEDVSKNSDVKALLETGWVSAETVGQLTRVNKKPLHIIYGPLSKAVIEPDVVLLRLNAKQAMMLHDSVPGLRIEGKPQCHIVAIAKEANEPALSVGCMLSRVRTGMSNNEMTCALPAQKLAEFIKQVKLGSIADTAVAAYAAADTKRFHRTT
jgi:uncharacterized protein (DUF169 family)